MIEDLTKKIIAEIPIDVSRLEITKIRSEQNEPKKFIDFLLGLYDYALINEIVKNLERYYKFLGIEIIAKTF